MDLPEFDISNNVIMYAALVGFISPLVLSLIIQTGWSVRVQAAVAFIYCILVGAGICYVLDLWQGADIVACILILFTVTVAFYKNFWKPTGVSPKIEEATTFRGEITSSETSGG